MDHRVQRMPVKSSSNALASATSTGYTSTSRPASRAARRTPRGVRRDNHRPPPQKNRTAAAPALCVRRYPAPPGSRTCRVYPPTSTQFDHVNIFCLLAQAGALQQHPAAPLSSIFRPLAPGARRCLRLPPHRFPGDRIEANRKVMDCHCYFLSPSTQEYNPYVTIGNEALDAPAGR